MTTLTICVSFCVPALFQHCFSASVFAFVLQQFALVLRQFTFVLQRVSASVLQKQSIAINDNLDHLRHLCCSHISNRPVAYRLALPDSLRCMHDVFHVSVLRHYISDPTHVIGMSSLQVSDEGALTAEPVHILDHRV
jgi:hypothetical protein